MKQKKLRSLSAMLLIGWCLIFLRCETTEKSMVRAVYLARTETGTQVLLWYQAPEASADASEASAAVQAAGAGGDTLEKALSAAEEALPQPVVMPAIRPVHRAAVRSFAMVFFFMNGFLSVSKIV